MRPIGSRRGAGTRPRSRTSSATHYRAVRGYVTGHYSGLDVDEVVASTFHVAWQRFDEIVADTARAWLIGVARNLIRNADRSRRRRAHFVDALVAARPAVSVGLAGSRVSLEDLDVLQSAFGRLRPDEQEILLLAAWEGLDRAPWVWSWECRRTRRRSGCSGLASGCAA